VTALAVRRLTATFALAGALLVLAAAARPAAPLSIVVYKSPSCGCCTKWVEYLRKQGYTVTVHDTEDVSPMKGEVGVPDALASCHTAIVDGYVVEGHVPAADIQRLLKERPKIVGLAVPGMVTGSPGMEGGTPAHYNVVAFDAKGQTTVYARY
jgi:hypothetical protein